MRPTSRLVVVAAAVAASAMLAGAADAQVLYWIDTSYGSPSIHRADANGVALTNVPLAAGTLPEGIALDAAGRAYWAESAWSNAKINSSTASLTSIAPIVTGGSAFRGVAVDAVAQLVYWTTSNLVTGPTIRRSALDGSGAVTLITLAPTANPRGIAVDHTGGKIYWADFDANAIYRANLDGTASAVFVGLPFGSSPYGVAVNSAGLQVFWTEYGSGSIKRILTNGSGLTTLESGLANPTYIALDLSLNRMYWAEGGAGSQHIGRANTTGGAITTLGTALTTYGGLAFQTNATVSVPEPTPALPTEFALERPWPNPGSGPVVIQYALPHEARVHLGVFDLQGREVAVLADGIAPAGDQAVRWETDGVRAGIYFVRMVADGRQWTRRLALTH